MVGTDALLIGTAPRRESATRAPAGRAHRGWVRETYVNSEEADAARVMFSIEWQAVENVGVYRRLIADDGKGMSASELVEFFNTFGGGVNQSGAHTKTSALEQRRPFSRGTHTGWWSCPGSMAKPQ